MRIEDAYKLADWMNRRLSPAAADAYRRFLDRSRAMGMTFLKEARIYAEQHPESECAPVPVVNAPPNMETWFGMTGMPSELITRAGRDFDYSGVDKEKFNLCKSWADNVVSTTSTRNGLYVWSPNQGNGKTTIATFTFKRICLELLKQNADVRAIWISELEMLRCLADTAFSRATTRSVWLQDLISCDLLLIDDLGQDRRPTDHVQEILLQIFDERDKFHPTIVTSNIEAQALPLEKSSVSRICGNFVQVRFKSDVDYRRQNQEVA